MASADDVSIQSRTPFIATPALGVAVQSGATSILSPTPSVERSITHQVDSRQIVKKWTVKGWQTFRPIATLTSDYSSCSPLFVNEMIPIIFE